MNKVQKPVILSNLHVIYNYVSKINFHCSVCCLLHACFLFGLLFVPEDKCGTFIRNVDGFLTGLHGITSLKRVVVIFLCVYL
jgi:hypothetical protein